MDEGMVKRNVAHICGSPKLLTLIYKFGSVDNLLKRSKIEETLSNCLIILDAAVESTDLTHRLQIDADIFSA